MEKKSQVSPSKKEHLSEVVFHACMEREQTLETLLRRLKLSTKCLYCSRLVLSSKTITAVQVKSTVTPRGGGGL